MQTNYRLTSTLGEIFVYVVYIIGIGFLGFLIYSIIINEMSSILTCLALNILLYFVFIKKILKFRKLTFDNKYFHLDDESISLKQINRIKPGELIILKNEKEVKIN